MKIAINKSEKIKDGISSVVIISKEKLSELDFLTAIEKKYAEDQVRVGEIQIEVSRLYYSVFLIVVSGKVSDIETEKLRKNLSTVESLLNYKKIEECQIISTVASEYTIAAIEGLVLSSYRFLNYYVDADKRMAVLRTIGVVDENVEQDRLSQLEIVLQGVFLARDFVNEPLSTLNAMVYADRVKLLSSDAGFSVEIRDKEWLEKEKMGGLLAVNKGSVDPPRFVEISWNSAKASNKKPVVLIGKGIVFDTGGISLKGTANMNYMKSDMGGSAAVVGAMYAIAKSHIPLNVKAYIPMTDNRPDGNAYVPGDVVKMHNGLHVEVLNTDAEGRMILADALSYAQKDDPELVIDVATLTGSASMAVGEHAVVTMGTASDKLFAKLDRTGHRVCERVVRFPIWDEYGDAVKSDVADIKNVASTPSAGAIVAGKFLQHFVDYPWIHLDISGSSFFKSKTNYRGVGGTAFGVRLLYNFLKDYIE